MAILELSTWPFWIGSCWMLIGGVLNLRKAIVPNAISIPMLLSGIIASVFVQLGAPSHGGGIGACLAGIVIGFLCLAPFWMLGRLGAGCVKMQMGFGAWMGCTFSIGITIGWTILATFSAALFMVAVWYLFYSVTPKHEGQEQEIVPGMGSLFPAQLPLSVGSIGTVIVLLWSFGG